MLISFILAITLNLDALAIGVSYGIRKIKVPIPSFLLISFISVFVTALASCLGDILTTIFPAGLGSFFLIAIGLHTVFSAFRKSETFDFDCSKTIDLREAAALSLALSLDATGAAISFAMSDGFHWFLPVAIGLCQFGFLWCGKKIGTRISKEGNTRALNIISGLILTLLGIFYLVL